MGTLEGRLARLRGFNGGVLESDPELAEESADLKRPSAFEFDGSRCRSCRA